MAAKLSAFFITLLINIAIGVAIFFFMLLGMNGFSESDASYGLGAYIVLAVLVTFLMSAAAVGTVHLLLKRGFGAFAAVGIAIPIFSIVGGGLKFVCCIIGLLVADYVRVNY